MSEAHFSITDPTYFLDAHETVLAYQGDVAPIGVTEHYGMSLAEGRVALSALVEPPMLLIERRTFVNIGGHQGVDILRTVVQLDEAGQVVTVGEQPEQQSRTLGPDGELQQVWTGPIELQPITGDTLVHHLDLLYDVVERIDEDDAAVLASREE